MSTSDRDNDAFDTQDLHGEIRGQGSQDPEQEIYFGSAAHDSDEEPSRPRALQKPSAANKFGVFMGMAGLIVGLGAGTFTAISLSKISTLRADIAIAFEDVDKNIAALGQSQTDTSVVINRLQTQSSDNAIAISQFDTARIVNDVKVVRSALEDVNIQLRESSMDSAQIIKNLQNEIIALKAEIEGLSSRQVEQQQAAVQQRLAAVATQTTRSNQPSIRTQEMLEGMNVVTVDSWGVESNVVLHDPKTGQYHTTAIGDRLLGWVYESADAEKGTVKFIKDQKVVVVRIQG